MTRWVRILLSIAAPVGFVLGLAAGAASGATFEVEQVNPAMLNVHVTIRAHRDGWARIYTEGREVIENPALGQYQQRNSAGRPYMRRVRLREGLNRFRLPVFRWQALDFEHYIARYPFGCGCDPAAVPMVNAPLNAAVVYGRALGKRFGGEARAAAM